MIKLFRSSRFSSIVVIVLIALLAWFWPLWEGVKYTFLFDTVSMPFYSFVAQLLSGYDLLSHLLTLLLIFSISVYLLRINEKFIIIRQRSYMPILFLMLVTSAMFPLQRLNPAVFAAFFIVLALDHIFACYQKKDALDNIFRAGISIGIATFFYAPVLVIAPILFISIILLRSADFREWIVATLGLFLPFLFYIFALFLLDKPISAIFSQFAINMHTNSYMAIDFAIPIIFVVCIGLPLVSSLVYLVPSMAQQKISVRKFQIINLWLLLLSVAAFIAIPSSYYEVIYIAAIPASFLLTNFFINVRINIFTRILFWLTIICLVLTQVAHFLF